MTHGFLESYLDVRSYNGRDDLLLMPLHFKSRDGKLYRAPTGSTTDGMSTPMIVRAIPGFEPFGKHWFSAGLHDSGYRGTLEVHDHVRYVPANLSRKETDLLMVEALETQGVPAWRRWIIYFGLRVGGVPNFKAKRRDE